MGRERLLRAGIHGVAFAAALTQRLEKVGGLVLRHGRAVADTSVRDGFEQRAGVRVGVVVGVGCDGERAAVEPRRIGLLVERDGPESRQEVRRLVTLL